VCPCHELDQIKPKNNDSFVAVAVYITESFIAERPLVYQPNRNAPAVPIANGFTAQIRSSQFISSFRGLKMSMITFTSRLLSRHSVSFSNSIASQPCPRCRAPAGLLLSVYTRCTNPTCKHTTIHFGEKEHPPRTEVGPRCRVPNSSGAEASRLVGSPSPRVFIFLLVYGQPLNRKMAATAES